MTKRMTIMLAALVVFVAAVGFVKYEQVRAAIAGASYQPPPEAVTTVVAKAERWEEQIHSIGSTTAVQGVTVSADLPGVVAALHFDSGRKVAKGEVLVELDTRQERALLRAGEAALDLAKANLDRMRGLRAKGVTSQAELDEAEAQFKSAEARVGEAEATIARKTIRAPFAGILGIRQVNLGQYVNSGDPIVPLQTLHPIYVDFAVPQQEIEHLAVGTPVHAATQGVETSGTIVAIDSVVDPATRNVRVRASVPNPDGKLRPGMFVETAIRVGDGQPIVAIPASSISYAPYGDSVFIVEDMKGQDGGTYLGVRQQFVKIGEARGDQVAITTGLKDGEQVVTSGAFKLRNGAAVEVNNQIRPSNDPTPHPEES